MNRQEAREGFWGEHHDLLSCRAWCRETHWIAAPATRRGGPWVDTVMVQRNTPDWMDWDEIVLVQRNTLNVRDWGLVGSLKMNFALWPQSSDIYWEVFQGRQKTGKKKAGEQ